MNQGHEECAHEVIEERVLCEREPRITRVCLHDHKDPIYAYDQLGVNVGYLVADHCQCCDAIIRRRGFA